MSAQNRFELLHQRVERLLLRCMEQARALQSARLECESLRAECVALRLERDHLRQQCQAVRQRLDGLIDQLPLGREAQP